jgi:hypothetical protein
MTTKLRELLNDYYTFKPVAIMTQKQIETGLYVLPRNAA